MIVSRQREEKSQPKKCLSWSFKINALYPFVVGFFAGFMLGFPFIHVFLYFQRKGLQVFLHTGEAETFGVEQSQ